MTSDGSLVASPGNPPSRAGAGGDDDAAIAQEIVSQLRADFRERDRLYQVIDTTVFLEDAVNIPRAYQKTALAVHSPLPLHIPTTVTAALSINPPRVQFPPVGKAGAVSVQNNATKREHFFEASWRRQEEEAERQLFRAFMFSLVTYGEGVLKCVERTKTAWGAYTAKAKRLKRRLEDDRDEDYGGLDQDAKDTVYHAQTEAWKQGEPYPIRSSDVDPSSFYYLKTQDGFSVASEVSEVPYFDALDRYADRVGLDANGNIVPQAMGLPRGQWHSAMSGQRTLQLTEVWTWDKCIYLLTGPNQRAKGRNGVGTGLAVKTLKHSYGNRWTKTLRGPYFHAQGITTSSRLPHKSGLGVLTPFLALFPQLNSLLTIQGNAAFLYGFPAFQRTVPPGAGEPPNPFGDDGALRGKTEADIVPGKILPWGVGPVEMPRGGPDIDKFLANVRQFLEMALPSLLQGVIEGGETGYLFNQAAHMARLAWDPIVSNAQVALQRRVAFESWMLENRVRESVYVWGVEPTPAARRQKGKGAWLSLGPEDLAGSHIYNVILDPETPSNKIIELRYWEGRLKLGLASRDQAIEALGDNPDEVEEALLLEEMKADPAVRAMLKQRTLQELGTIDAKLLAGKANQPDLTQGPGGPPGAPGGQPAIGDPALGQVFSPGAGMPAGGPPPPPGVPTGGPGFGPPGTPVGAPGGIPGPPQGAFPLP